MAPTKTGSLLTGLQTWPGLIVPNHRISNDTAIFLVRTVIGLPARGSSAFKLDPEMLRAISVDKSPTVCGTFLWPFLDFGRGRLHTGLGKCREALERERKRRHLRAHRFCANLFVCWSSNFTRLVRDARGWAPSDLSFLYIWPSIGNFDICIPSYLRLRTFVTSSYSKYIEDSLWNLPPKYT